MCDDCVRMSAMDTARFSSTIHVGNRLTNSGWARVSAVDEVSKEKMPVTMAEFLSLEDNSRDPNILRLARTVNERIERILEPEMIPA